MTAKKKKIGASGRLGAGYGRPKERLNAVEQKQRVRQNCPFCNGKAKRKSKGVWECNKCGKIFTGGTFYLS